MSEFVVHCKKAKFDVYIGRGGDPGVNIFGNPFSFKVGTEAEIVVESREACVQAYRDWLAGTKWQHVDPDRRKAILKAIPSLKGKVLGCWCSPEACHGDVLAELANAEPKAGVAKLPIVKPGNIFSGDKSARTVLTNPTELARKKGNLRRSYPVLFRDRLYSDAEEAYQHQKLIGPWLTLRDRIKLCSEVIAAKLTQYPQLVEFISVNGGVPWLEKCSHHVHAKTEAFTEWEGDGRNSAFIRALIVAYEEVSNG